MRRAILALLLVVVGSEAFQAICPSVCSCKWRNGKRWVECTSRGQISIPENIDPETQVLDLGGNNLQILPREVFSRHGLLNLQKLKLSDCNIGQIDPTAFRGLTNLIELDLSSNLLTSVPTPTFSDIPYLRELALNNNPLQKIEGHAFEMVPQIVSLDISGCQVKRVAARAFHQIEGLERLYLHNNRIAELKQRTVESVSRLHSLTLHGNPWHCDCHLRPLLLWLQDANLPMVDLPKCKTPQRLAGNRFADTPIEEFACPPEVLGTTRYLEATRGSNATVTCKVSGVPGARVRWRRNGQEVRNTSLTGPATSPRRWTMQQAGRGHILSTLVISPAQDSDAGQYLCVAENKAGRTEANFTLVVGYFGGGGPLQPGEVVGVAITLILLLLIVMVVIGVLVLKLRPSALRTEKLFRGRDSANSGEAGGRTIEMSYTTVQNGSSGVVIAGTTYTHATNGIGATGYTNPDVVPRLQSPGDQPGGSLKRGNTRVVGEEERRRGGGGGGGGEEESVEAEQNRANGLAASGLGEGGGGRGGKLRYENFPPPLSSMGTSTGGDPGLLQPEEVYSGSSLYSNPGPSLPHHSFSPRLELGAMQRFPGTKDPLDTRLSGAVNGSFAEEELGTPVFHRNQQFQPGVFPPSPHQLRTLGRASHTLGHTSLDPSAFPRLGPSSHHGTLPRNFAHSSLSSHPPHSSHPPLSSLSSQPPHSSLSPSFHPPVGPGWAADPVGAPQWAGESRLQGVPEWSGEPRPFPPDYGLPVHRRAEVHLATNPLDTLREEEFPPTPGYTGAIQALEMINQSSGGYSAFKSLLDSSSQESSGRGSSSSGSSKVWSSAVAPTKPGPFPGSVSARESPDEGIQTDSGTDV